MGKDVHRGHKALSRERRAVLLFATLHKQFIIQAIIKKFYGSSPNEYL